MPLFRCDDPLVDAIRDTYSAVPLRAPRADVQPLDVVGANEQKSSYFGPLQDLLVDDTPLGLTPQRQATTDAVRKKTRSVSIDLGLDLLGGFLAAWGIPSAGIALKLSGTTAVSFSFAQVWRYYVPPSALGRAIAKRRVDVSNPVVPNFFGDDALAMLVIDAIITSRDFTLTIERQHDSSVSVDVPAIQQLVGKATAKVSVSSSDAKTLTFSGDIDMPFAFSCVPFVLDDQGVVETIKPHSDIKPFGFAPGGEIASEQRVLLSKEPALLSFDDVSDAT